MDANGQEVQHRSADRSRRTRPTKGVPGSLVSHIRYRHAVGSCWWNCFGRQTAQQWFTALWRDPSTDFGRGMGPGPKRNAGAREQVTPRPASWLSALKFHQRPGPSGPDQAKWIHCLRYDRSRNLVFSAGFFVTAKQLVPASPPVCIFLCAPFATRFLPSWCPPLARRRLIRHQLPVVTLYRDTVQPHKPENPCNGQCHFHVWAKNSLIRPRSVSLPAIPSRRRIAQVCAA